MFKLIKHVIPMHAIKRVFELPPSELDKIRVSFEFLKNHVKLKLIIIAIMIKAFYLPVGYVSSFGIC